jgi:hypothetical protein
LVEHSLLHIYGPQLYAMTGENFKPYFLLARLAGATPVRDCSSCKYLGKFFTFLRTSSHRIERPIQ